MFKIFFKRNHAFQPSQLSKEELDLVILANIQVSTHGRDKQVGEKRSRSPRCYFAFKSIPICKKMFLQLYGIRDHRFRSLKEHYDNFGTYPRTHGNKKRMPRNTLPHATIVDIKALISNYVKENEVLLLGRIPSTRMTTLSCYHRVKVKWEHVSVIPKAVKLRVKRRYGILNLWTCGRISSLTSLWLNP